MATRREPAWDTRGDPCAPPVRSANVAPPPGPPVATTPGNDPVRSVVVPPLLAQTAAPHSRCRRPRSRARGTKGRCAAERAREPAETGRGGRGRRIPGGDDFGGQRKLDDDCSAGAGST